MASILPVSDLRNYNEVLKKCHKGEPVYLTKNGRGRFVCLLYTSPSPRDA